LKDKALFQQVIDRYREVNIQDQEVSELILFESILRKEGPLYVKLASFNLGG
jgi:2'-5' RNA ligase